MLINYRILINIVYFLSPIIIILRLIKKKENLYRFREKFCFFTKRRLNGSLVWIHGASVGEFQSVVPLIEKYEKKKDIDQILVTSNTLSSSKVISKYKFKKVTHQFFPIDTNHNTRKFLDYWKPSL
jgi:3-deoxy-D-manno-octulosonic-acid transferase